MCIRDRPIDRVFTMEGFGTVVTGTLLEGCCQVGQEVELYPTERTVKIREIQTHGHRVDMAYAGQRTALNLVNIKKDEINRGAVSYTHLILGRMKQKKGRNRKTE